jgi:hypothetical protein
MSNHRAHLNDGPVEIPAWKSCQGCRHFRRFLHHAGASGACAEPTVVASFVILAARQVNRSQDGRVVTPSWCPVLVREAL